MPTDEKIILWASYYEVHAFKDKRQLSRIIQAFVTSRSVAGPELLVYFQDWF